MAAPILSQETNEPSDSTSASLKELAPGVDQILERSALLPQQKHELRRQLVGAIAQRPEYEWIKRESGVSFNPLPARVTEILLRECQCSNVSTLRAAITLASGIKTRPSSENQEHDHADLAYSLDILRHLHYPSVQDSTRQAILQDLPKVIEIEPGDAPMERLLTLYDAALNRTKKRYGGDNHS
ncbi:hypothetical protein EBR25_05810 [bacterium]|nr:hypothetical protein [bacterium]